MFARAFLGLPDVDPTPQDGYVAAWSAGVGRALWKPITGALLSGFAAGLVAFGAATGGLTTDATLSYSGGVLSATSLATTSTSSLGDQLTLTRPTTATNTLSTAFLVNRTTTGTAASGLGSAWSMQIQNDAGSLYVGARISTVLTTVTSGAEVAKLSLWVGGGGSNATIASREWLTLMGDTGVVTIASTAASSSTTTGSLVNAGGFGNAGNAYIGGTLNVTGNAAIAGTSSSTACLTLGQGNNPLTGSTQTGCFVNMTGTTAGTTLRGAQFSISSAASAYTVTSATAFLALSIGLGAGSTITRATGAWIDPQSSGTNNCGVLISSSLTYTGNWAIRSESTYASQFAGSLLSTHATAGIGYSTGAGGTVTQATSKATGVTLNTVCGQITMNAAALAAGAKVTFTLTDSAIAATDEVGVCVASGGTANAYRASVTAVAAGSCAITVENITAGSLSEAPVLTFAVHKAVTS